MTPPLPKGHPAPAQSQQDAEAGSQPAATQGAPPCPAAVGVSYLAWSPLPQQLPSLRSLPALPPAPPPRDVSAAAPARRPSHRTAPLLAPCCPSQRLPQQQEGESHPLVLHLPGGPAPYHPLQPPGRAGHRGRTGREQEVRWAKGSDARSRLSVPRGGRAEMVTGGRLREPGGALLPSSHPCSPAPFSPAVTLIPLCHSPRQSPLFSTQSCTAPSHPTPSHTLPCSRFVPQPHALSVTGPCTGPCCATPHAAPAPAGFGLLAHSRRPCRDSSSPPG